MPGCVYVLGSPWRNEAEAKKKRKVAKRKAITELEERVKREMEKPESSPLRKARYSFSIFSEPEKLVYFSESSTTLSSTKREATNVLAVMTKRHGPKAQAQVYRNGRLFCTRTKSSEWIHPPKELRTNHMAVKRVQECR